MQGCPTAHPGFLFFGQVTSRAPPHLPYGATGDGGAVDPVSTGISGDVVAGAIAVVVSSPGIPTTEVRRQC